MIFAPHSFLALIIFGFTLGGFFILGEITEGKERKIEEEKLYMISFGASLLCALMYWIPTSMSAYAKLRLAQRLDRKLDENRNKASHNQPQPTDTTRSNQT